MASTPSWKLIFVALLVLEMWASQAIARSLQDASMVERHEQWMGQYGRVYNDNAEKAMRYRIFKENVEYIETFNKAGTRHYKLGFNQFADLTNKEFQASRNGYKMSSNQNAPKASSFRYENDTAVPSSMTKLVAEILGNQLISATICGCRGTSATSFGYRDTSATCFFFIM
ncbi:Senescence-specific cysteine protease SAG39 [Forsythia ovata]|uniref:Senescence-specific cysteine protease SAG39 n=1 Tax=Forsythia ovata TaxID=205694 RepID=A0ABD1T9K8_9LAMI